MYMQMYRIKGCYFHRAYFMSFFRRSMLITLVSGLKRRSSHYKQWTWKKWGVIIFFSSQNLLSGSKMMKIFYETYFMEIRKQKIHYLDSIVGMGEDPWHEPTLRGSSPVLPSRGATSVILFVYPWWERKQRSIAPPTYHAVPASQLVWTRLN